MSRWLIPEITMLAVLALGARAEEFEHRVSLTGQTLRRNQNRSQFFPTQAVAMRLRLTWVSARSGALHDETSTRVVADEDGHFAVDFPLYRRTIFRT